MAVDAPDVVQPIETENRVLKISRIEKHQHESRQHVVDGELKMTVVLATALVRFQLGTSITPPYRALMDSGAQLNCITSECMKSLRLATTKCNQLVIGVGGEVTLNQKVSLNLTSWFESNVALTVELFITNDFTGIYPSGRLDVSPPPCVTLADPQFDVPAPVQLLLGAETWARLVLPDVVNHVNGGVIQQTHFGYIVLGRFLLEKDHVLNCSILTAGCGKNDTEEGNLQKMMERFWQIETINDSEKIRSFDEEQAERIFIGNYRRRRDGRYVVKIPMRENSFPIADSRNIALRRFHQLERQLQNNEQLRMKYVDFMREYESLGHMKKADKRAIPGQTVYIPHHAITKKFRVVFDASCMNVAGNSLNRLQYVGEKLQHDLQDQIMRFRRGEIAVVTDIEKMYRQIFIDDRQWDLQRIFWRENPYVPLAEYWLMVVTYGLASSGHLAVRAMIQCADDNADKFPMAAQAIKKCFYMDDGLLNGDNVQEMKILCKEIDFVLRTGGMQLKNWISNSIEIQRYMAGMLCDIDVDLNKEDETKILGLRWLTKTDELTIFVRTEGLMEKDTKRTILSGISRLYDPNGFVSPVVVTAKIIMQDLWRNNLTWDEKVSEAMLKRWKQFVYDMAHLRHFRIPRWLGTKNAFQVQMHGFSDASIHASCRTVCSHNQSGWQHKLCIASGQIKNSTN